MKNFAYAFCLLSAIVTPAGRAADAPAAVTPAGRIDLFNGKDLSGWTVFLRGDTPAADTYSVSNGLLHCTGQPFGYVRTDKTFRDYKLTVEWRYVKVAEHADNSGVFVHVQLPDHVWPKCIENQGQNRHQGDLIFLGGSTYKGPAGPTKTPSRMQGQPNEKAVGEWNTYEVVCRGDTVKSYVNGRLLNQVEGCNISAGSIGVQSEGGEWELRKIYLEPLPPADP